MVSRECLGKGEIETFPNVRFGFEIASVRDAIEIAVGPQVEPVPFSITAQFNLKSCEVAQVTELRLRAN